MIKNFMAIENYITGEDFKTSLSVKCPKCSNYKSRLQFISEISKGKNILHLGCSDHIELIEKRLKNNTWLHKIITENSVECLGIDINNDGLNLCKKFGFYNVIYGDITKDNIVEIKEKHWDYLIMGEILEHVDNPVSFLQNILKFYSEYIDKIIITVPNVFQAEIIWNALLGREIINSDHRYWFTPYTIWKVGDKAGLKLDDMQMCLFQYPLHEDYINIKQINKLTVQRIIHSNPFSKQKLVGLLKYIFYKMIVNDNWLLNGHIVAIFSKK